MNRMLGKAAIVTGGALGIGRACALMLAEEGASVAVTDVDVAKGSLAVDEIRRRGGAAEFIEHDVADESQWDRVMKFVVENELTVGDENPDTRELIEVHVTELRFLYNPIDPSRLREKDLDQKAKNSL